MSDDVRTTAIATDAFLDLRPSEPPLPKLVKGLFGERAARPWRTTQDNLYALVALTHYVKSRPSERGDASTAHPRATRSRARRATSAARARTSGALRSVGRREAARRRSRCRAKGGEVLYSSLLRFRRDVAHQKATRTS